MAALWLVTLFLLSFYNSLTLNVRGQAFGDEGIGEDALPFRGLSILTELNPEKTDDGRELIQGDIVPPPTTGREKPDKMKGIVNIATLWTNGKISYNFHSSVDDDLKVLIRESMDEWERHSCLKFTEKQMDLNYLRFRADKEGCWSMIGRINTPFYPQDVSIGQRCNKSYVVIHEIGHAIGFYHEQSRNDRDDFIYILWHNMPVARYSQFDKGIENPRGVEYDYTSVMHYGAMAFTSKYFQKNTIAARNPHHQTLIGSGMRISFRDAKMINKMYSCSAHCPNVKNETQCENGGFLSPYRGDDEPCHCVCPPGASGEYCESIPDPLEYYELSPCGGNVTSEMDIETPGYPQRGPLKDSCSWWIQAPEGQRAQVEFIDFSFHPRYTVNGSLYYDRCYHERVEIRTRQRYDGDMFCGEDIPPGTVATSAEREFIIIIDTKEEVMEGRGLKARVSFVPANTTEYTDRILTSFLP